MQLRHSPWPAAVVAALCCLAPVRARTQSPGPPPNVLVAVADDWAWPYAGAYGDTAARTPGFDRVAAEGVLFTRAFAASPSCTASRGALLTGQSIWRLQESADLWSALAASLATYPDLLEQEGYHVGYTSKGWGPGSLAAAGRTRNPAGPSYASFDAFLAAWPAGVPFCFWLGSHDPHRPYVAGSGIAAGIDPAAVQLPPCLPDDAAVRSDLCDYYLAVQRFDAVVESALSRLALLGELDHTIVVVTSDNGMPFPRAKANLYDLGARVPLAVRWGDRVLPGRVVDDFVALTDLAPTLLEAAAAPPPPAMTGRSFLDVLLSAAQGRVDPSRDRVFLGRERHVPLQRCRPIGYPMRALRTDDWLYIANLEPTRWPAGTPYAANAYNGAAYADVDDSPTKRFMLASRGSTAVAPLFSLCFGPRPAEELYDLRADPAQVVDVAALPAYAAVRDQLAQALRAELVRTGDPRLGPGPAPFDDYPYRNPSVPPPGLTTDVDEVSVRTGGAQMLSIAVGEARAGKVFLVLGSLSGRWPGITLGPAGWLALNPDPYFLLSAAPPHPLIPGSFGALGPGGTAAATFSLPASLLRGSMAGLVFDHACLVLDPASGLALGATNACSLLLTP